MHGNAGFGGPTPASHGGVEVKRLFAPVAIAAGILALSPGSAFGKTLRVDNNPADDCQGTFPSIQMAVTAASPGDTVKVCPGTYNEQVRITEKDKLKLESQKPQQAVIK